MGAWKKGHRWPRLYPRKSSVRYLQPPNAVGSADAEGGHRIDGGPAGGKENARRFLSAQADHLAGARWSEKAPACSVRNDGGVRRYDDQHRSGQSPKYGRLRGVKPQKCYSV